MDTLTEILTATDPKDLFGDLSGDALSKKFRKLKKQSHPDRYADNFKARATEAFNRLTELWDELNGVSRRPASSAFTFTTKTRTYVFGDKISDDTVSTFYSAEYREGDTAHRVLVRFSKAPACNSALEAHAKAIKKLNDEVPKEHSIFHPQLVEIARHRDASTATERTVVITQAGPSRYLGELIHLRETYGPPIDARDMAWIFRRLLVALGTAHDAGIALNAVTYDNVLISPEDHGLLLLDWQLSSALTEDLRVDDIWGAAVLMEGILRASPSVPRQITAFLHGCMLNKLPSAAQILAEFDDLIERLYGPRKFREFYVPSETTKGN